MDEPGVRRGGEGGQGCKEKQPVREATFDSPGSAMGGASKSGLRGEREPREGIRRAGVGGGGVKR